MGEGNPSITDSKISVLLIGVGSAALMVTIYHCIAVGWCNRFRNSSSPQHPRAFVTDIVDTPSIENSAAQLIPAHKYQKGMGMVGDDSTCAICLSEFEEGEVVRTLPECMHSYHAPCIDMWLYSHSSCPMCRMDATPSPQIFQRAPELSSEGLESGMLPSIIVQSRII